MFSKFKLIVYKKIYEVMFWTFLLPTLFRIWHFYCSKLAHSLLRKGANKKPNCLGTGDNENGASGQRSEWRGNPEEDPAPHEGVREGGGGQHSGVQASLQAEE